MAGYVWVDDALINACTCGKTFSLFVRRVRLDSRLVLLETNLIDSLLWIIQHHCRRCGKVFCNECSNQRIELPADGYPEKAAACELSSSHFTVLRYASVGHAMVSRLVKLKVTK